MTHRSPTDLGYAMYNIALKKRLGLTITSEQEPERGRVYRIADDDAS